MAKAPADDKLGYDYDRDTPPAPPGGAPPADTGPESMAAYPTSTLSTWRKDLRAPSVTDMSFLSALAGVVGMLLDREIGHPGRRKRDKAAAEAHAKAEHDAKVKVINDKAEADTKALGDKPDPAAKKAIDDKKKLDLDAIEAELKREEMATRHAEEAQKLAAKQAEESAKAGPATHAPG